jgi:broad specificity phosphatase PhoE
MELRVQGVANLVLVRHGQSVRNIAESKGPFFKDNQEREKYGNCRDDLIPLTELGQRQAKCAGKGLKRELLVFDNVIHSGYRRTQQTTEGILKAFTKRELEEMAIMEDLLIRERDSGYLVNFTEEEVRKTFPWWGDYWFNSDPFLVTPLGGESLAKMCEGRLTEFFRRLEGRCLTAGWRDRKNVLLVSHGRAILGMRYLLEGWSHERVNHEIRHCNPPNCSATWYQFDLSGKAELKFANKVYK